MLQLEQSHRHHPSKLLSLRPASPPIFEAVAIMVFVLGPDNSLQHEASPMALAIIIRQCIMYGQVFCILQMIAPFESIYKLYNDKSSGDIHLKLSKIYTIAMQLSSTVRALVSG